MFIKEKINEIKNNRIIKNFSILFMSDALVSVVGMLNMLMIINSIGSYNNGVLLMIQTYVLLMSDIFNFQCFNGIICYMPKLLKENNKEKLALYINQALLLEIISGSVAFVVGQILIYRVAVFMKWDPIIVTAVRLYLITNVINLSGTCTAVLRVFDEFKKVSIINIIIVILRMILYSIGWLKIRNIQFYIIAEIIIDLSNKILNIIFMSKVLRRNKIRKYFRFKVNFDIEFIKFNFYSNISQTIDIPVYHITTFVINKFLGFNEITVFKVIQKIGSIIEKLGKPLNQIVYPEISMYVAEKNFKKVNRLTAKIFKFFSMIAIAATILLVITNDIWQVMFFGNVTITTLIVMIMYLVLLIFINSTSTIHAIFIAMELIKYNIPIQLVINTIYLITLIFFTINYGLIGVVVARILQSFMITVIKYIILVKKGALQLSFKKSLKYIG